MADGHSGKGGPGTAGVEAGFRALRHGGNLRAELSGISRFQVYKELGLPSDCSHFLCTPD